MPQCTRTRPPAHADTHIHTQSAAYGCCLSAGKRIQRLHVTRMCCAPARMCLKMRLDLIVHSEEGEGKPLLPPTDTMTLEGD